MMKDLNSTHSRRAMFALTSCVMLLSGCATGRDYEMGQRAERSGDAQQAYDAYCRAASQNPDNAVIQSAIKRVTPKAADYWEKQGHLAMNQGRYQDSWRSFMRVLEIRPDHPSAALVIRQLEQQHPTEVAFAKQDYEQRGARSLVVSKDGSNAPAMPGGGAVQVAQRDNRPDLGSEDDVYVPPSRTRQPPPPPPPTAGKYGAQSGVGVGGITSSPTPTASSGAPIPYNPPVSTYSQNEPYQPTAPIPSNTASARPYTYDAPPSYDQGMTASVGPPSGYMLVRTLSKKDRRYARRREFVDGVAIRLDDVDDHDCDLELYMGGVRVVEIKHIRPNETTRFVGQTGRQFQLTVLEMRESTETVRIGVSAL